MVGAPLSGRSPSGTRPPLQQPCGDASQGLRAAFHFASHLVPIFHQPHFVIPSSQSTNPPTLLAGFFPRPLNCALSQHQETPELEFLLSMLPSFPPPQLRDLQVSNLVANSSVALLYELLVRRFQRVQQQAAHSRTPPSIDPMSPPPSADSCWGTKPSRSKQHNQEPPGNKTPADLSTTHAPRRSTHSI